MEKAESFSITITPEDYQIIFNIPLAEAEELLSSHIDGGIDDYLQNVIWADVRRFIERFHNQYYQG